MTRIQKDVVSEKNRSQDFLKDCAELYYFDEKSIELVSFSDNTRHGTDSCLFSLLKENRIIKTKNSVSIPLKSNGKTEGLILLKDSNYKEKEIDNFVDSVMKNSFFNRNKGKYSYLVKNELITGEVLENLILKSDNPEELLGENFKIDKNKLLSSYSDYYGIPSIDLESDNIDKDIISVISLSFMRKNLFVPFRKEDNKICIAIYDPEDTDLKNILYSAYQAPIKYYAALKSDIEECLDQLEQKDNSSIDYLIDQLEVKSDFDESENEINEENSVIIKLVNKIIIEASEKNASDIHFEPERSKGATDVRVRIDGILEEFRKIPRHLSNAVISRIKIMAEMDISERRRPQDGRVHFRNSGISLELRIATNVTSLGMEDVVIRILPPGGVIPLDSIGFSKRNLELFKRSITKPHGLILVCGPTGSGKTTTLHSALNHINKPNIKILTAEDPVEITQSGLRQVQAKPSIGLNFVSILKSFLRLDPDVIMIGEMRDGETIKTAIEASLTGHLVFSTLHTNSAAESIARLNERKIDPFNFSDSLICILSQRLVRVLCSHCKIEYKADEELKSMLKTEKKDLTLFKPKGCPSCNYSGFSGRVAIHELLMADEGIKSLIRQRATVDRVFEYAAGNGMNTLLEDAREKVFEGLLDIGEVLRVC